MHVSDLSATDTRTRWRIFSGALIGKGFSRWHDCCFSVEARHWRGPGGHATIPLLQDEYSDEPHAPTLRRSRRLARFSWRRPVFRSRALLRCRRSRHGQGRCLATAGDGDACGTTSRCACRQTRGCLGSACSDRRFFGTERRRRQQSRRRQPGRHAQTRLALAIVPARRHQIGAFARLARKFQHVRAPRAKASTRPHASRESCHTPARLARNRSIPSQSRNVEFRSDRREPTVARGAAASVHRLDRIADQPFAQARFDAR